MLTKPNDRFITQVPTIHREDGFAFRIYTDDHRPPHVHALKAGEFAKIGIGDSANSAVVLDPGTLGGRDLVRAVRIVDERWTEFLLRWSEIHG
jgi:hypothetical protein